MRVCVRLADDLVAEFRDTPDAVEFQPTESISSVPGQSADSCADAGVATEATLAQLQASSDEAVVAGCRAA